MKELLKYKPIGIQEEADYETFLYAYQNFKGILTRENPYAHITASNWIVNEDFTKVLMIYHNIYKSWSWTGGHLDGNENILEVSLKEAKEETGIKEFKVLSNGIYSIEILPVIPHIKRGKFVSGHVHINATYLLQANESDLIVVNEEETSGCKWIPIDEVLDCIGDNEKELMVPIYSKLLSRLPK